MSDEIVIRYCAPTLAAIKTGSLFNCPFENRAELTLAHESVTANNAPDDDAIAACKALGAALS